MITEQDWLLAVEEFGEEAFRRFYFLDQDGRPEFFHANSEIEDGGFDYIHFKPMPELFRHDVEVYGEDNAKFIWNIKHGLCSRKNSAALPFNLKRAQNRDIVEFCDTSENDLSGAIKTKWYVLNDVEIVGDIVVGKCGAFTLNFEPDEYHLLRHKYPPKI